MTTRSLKDQRDAEVEVEPHQNGNGNPEEALNSLEGLANDQGEDPDGQLFVMENGVKIGLRDLADRNTPIFYEFKLDSKGVKGAQGMGLIAFKDPDRVLVVPGRGGKVVVDPTYDTDGVVKHVTVRQHFKPTQVIDGRTEAAQVALRGE